MMVQFTAQGTNAVGSVAQVRHPCYLTSMLLCFCLCRRAESMVQLCALMAWVSQLPLMTSHFKFLDVQFLTQQTKRDFELCRRSYNCFSIAYSECRFLLLQPKIDEEAREHTLVLCLHIFLLKHLNTYEIKIKYSKKRNM